MPDGNRYNMERLAKRAKVPVEHVSRIFRTIRTVLEEGSNVTIASFGRFAPVINEPRPLRSPIVPRGTNVRRRRVIRFTMSNSLREEWLLED